MRDSHDVKRRRVIIPENTHFVEIKKEYEFIECHVFEGPLYLHFSQKEMAGEKVTIKITDGDYDVSISSDSGLVCGRHEFAFGAKHGAMTFVFGDEDTELEAESTDVKGCAGSQDSRITLLESFAANNMNESTSLQEFLAALGAIASDAHRRLDEISGCGGSEGLEREENIMKFLNKCSAMQE